MTVYHHRAAAQIANFILGKWKDNEWLNDFISSDIELTGNPSPFPSPFQVHFGVRLVQNRLQSGLHSGLRNGLGLQSGLQNDSPEGVENGPLGQQIKNHRTGMESSQK